VAMRKNKRDENLQKRRNMAGGEVAMSEGALSVAGVPQNSQAQLQKLYELVQQISQPDIVNQRAATEGFRKLLSIEKNPPIEEVIRQGVIPKFVQFLQYPDAKLQFEAAWALTNVASGTPDQTRAVIDAGAVPIFVQLLRNPDSDVREQAVWALGNIAGDSPKCRDLVLGSNTMEPLLELLEPQASVSMLRNATWTLSNLCRGKPQPDFNMVRIALPKLSQLLTSADEEVLTDACWALSYLSDGEDSKIEEVLRVGVVRRLVELLAHKSASVLVPALRTVGNIVTGNDQQTQQVINAGALEALRVLLEVSGRKSIRKEACWTISNITAGTRDQIQAVIERNIIPTLVQMLEGESFDIKKEAAWAISNATSGGDHNQVAYLVQCNCIPPLCALLECGDTKIVTVVLEALENILKVGQSAAEMAGSMDDNPFRDIIEECGGIDKIEALQNFDKQEIVEKAVELICKYFGQDDTEPGDNAMLNPEVQGNQFGFGANMPSGGFNF